MRNILIILLTVVIVIAGAFLPELLLSSDQPEVELNYQMVNVVSGNSSDYAWRMERLSEHYFGEGTQLLNTYMSEIVPSEEGSESYTQFMNALMQLRGLGVVPEQVMEVLEGSQDYRIRNYYMFDNESVNGFRYAEFVAAAGSWRVTMCMDVESGKLAKIEYGGSKLIPEKMAIPETSWYDVLRGYGDYLGLSPNKLPDSRLPVQEAAANSARQYYDSCTAEHWAAPVAPENSAWMELRVLREQFQVTIAVYDGGK